MEKSALSGSQQAGHPEGRECRLLPDDRRREIANRVRESSFVLIGDLSREFGVSEMTIRRDLDWLQQLGRARRVRGGAIISDGHLPEVSYVEKREADVDRKIAVACRAAEMVEPGDALLLTAGTTVRHLAERIKAIDGLIVVTNGIDVAYELALCQSIRTVVLGGDVRTSLAIVGATAEKDLAGVHYVNKLFMGADGISSSHGITTTHPLEARLYCQMMGIAERVIVVADSSKIGKSAFSYVSDVGAAHCLITDGDADQDECERIAQSGLPVEKVPLT